MVLKSRDHVSEKGLTNPDPEKFTTGAYLKIGFFRTDSDLLSHDVIRGGLFTQADKALDLLLTKYLRAGISYRGTQRFERFPVPEAALREALINAIAHKDYASGVPIQISVYDDKLMMWNPGQLPPDWSLDRLLAKHSSQPANPDIANTFFRAGKVESWGRGIDLIGNKCIEQGYPFPRFNCDSSGLWIDFVFPKAPLDNAELGGAEGTGKTIVGTAQETTQETAQERIMDTLRKRPSITRRELAEKIGLSEDGIKYHLNKLKLAGIIRHVGSTKAGHWEVLT